MAARRLHGLVYATIVLCLLAIAVCGLALGLNQWFKSKAIADNNSLHIDVSYGLFKGEKIKTGTNIQTYNLQVVCQASGNKCMFSCGSTPELRKQDLAQLINNGTSDEATFCKAADVRSSKQNPGDPKPVTEPVFINFALYVLTIAFIALAIAFSALAGGQALYNTYRTPIQPILSVLGLYIWNGISALCVVLAMIMWGIAFATSLNKNAAISDTLELRGVYDSKGKGSLGISFWLLILSFLFSISNMGILKYRSWKIIQMEAKNVRVMNTKLDSGDILLF